MRIKMAWLFLLIKVIFIYTIQYTVYYVISCVCRDSRIWIGPYVRMTILCRKIISKSSTHVPTCFQDFVLLLLLYECIICAFKGPNLLNKCKCRKFHMLSDFSIMFNNSAFLLFQNTGVDPLILIFLCILDTMQLQFYAHNSCIQATFTKWSHFLAFR